MLKSSADFDSEAALVNFLIQHARAFVSQNASMAYGGAQGYARISSDSCIYKRRQVPSEDDVDLRFEMVGLDERDIDTDEDRDHGKMCSPLYRVARGGDDSDATDEGPSPARLGRKVLSKKKERAPPRSQLQRYKLTRDLPTTWSAPPRVLCVTRRHLRKGKYVDFLGEYHLDLIQENGGAAIMIPRTALTVPALAEYLPMDGLLVVEGNDISDEVLEKYGCCAPDRLDGEDAMKWASDTEFEALWHFEALRIFFAKLRFSSSS